MRKYKATICVGIQTIEEIIYANNINEARGIANRRAYELSNWGERYLGKVSVSPIKENK